MASARTGSGFGLNPIGFAEIEAWARVTGRDPTPWEVSVLRRMDDAALRVAAKKAKRAGKDKSVGRAEAQEIAPDDWQALDRALDRLG